MEAKEWRKRNAHFPFHGLHSFARSGPRRLALGPGGTPQEISRGQARAAGAAPGCGTERAMPQWGIEEAFWTVRRRGQVGPSAISQHSGPFLRCPAGARSHSSPLPRAASAADLPPANFLRRLSGTGTGRPRTDHGKAPAREWRSQVVRLRLRRAVFIVSLWFIAIGPTESIRPSSTNEHQFEPPWTPGLRMPSYYPCPSVSIRG